MAEGIIDIPKLRLVETRIKFNLTLNANSGKSLLSIIDYSIQVPSGYGFLTNVNVYISGAIGVIAMFDGTNAYFHTQPLIYITNLSNTNYSNQSMTLVIATLVQQSLYAPKVTNVIE